MWTLAKYLAVAAGSRNCSTPSQIKRLAISTRARKGQRAMILCIGISSSDIIRIVGHVGLAIKLWWILCCNAGAKRSALGTEGEQQAHIQRQAIEVTQARPSLWPTWLVIPR